MGLLSTHLPASEVFVAPSSIRPATEPDLLEAAFRSVIGAARQSQPEGYLMLYTVTRTPDGEKFYGQAKILGELSPQKISTLRTDTPLAFTQTDRDAAKSIRELGITRVVTVGDAAAGEKSTPTPADIPLAELTAGSFFERLLVQNTIPVWLEPVAFVPVSDSPGPLRRRTVSLYRVNFNQTPAEAHYRLASLLTLQSAYPEALTHFATAAELDPAAAAAWLRQGEILLRGREWPAARNKFERGIALSSPEERYKLFTQAGLAFENAGDLKTAVAMYRRAVGEDMTNSIALNNLSWHLATAGDDTIRDGPLALSLAQAADLAEPDSAGNLDTLAAALAENGRFAEAIATAQRAVELATAAKDPVLLESVRAHRANYLAGKPWRNQPSSRSQ